VEIKTKQVNNYSEGKLNRKEGYPYPEH